MKRISTLLLAGAMLIGSLGAAQAIDVKVKGQWDFAFGWQYHDSFSSNRNVERNSDNKRSDDPIIARQRIRTQVDFIASENLSSTWMFEWGQTDWGRTGSKGYSSVGRGATGALDADGVGIEVKRAFLDWMVPNTSLSFRMGIQYLNLPMGTSYLNPVFGADVAGITANYKFNDMFSLSAFWARPFDQFENDSNGPKNSRGGVRNLNDEMDMFGVILPIVGDGWKVTPWGVFSSVGGDSGYHDYIVGYNGFLGDNESLSSRGRQVAWWAGLAFSLDMFDPLTFGMDVMYGDVHRGNTTLTQTIGSNKFDTDLGRIGTRGWFIDATLDYKLSWATPGLFGWWSSGDKASRVRDGQYGRIPVVGVDDGFGPTSFGFPGGVNIGTDSRISYTGVGTWGVGLQLANMSFIEKLEHTIRVAYYQGTNDHKVITQGWGALPLSAESVYMTTKDSAIEVNFDHKYQIYENLAAYLELGFIHLDMDNKVWGDKYKDNNAWKAQVLFQYKF